MGRINGKLINFLRRNLDEECFINLKYELDENGLKSDVFYLEMPRYERNRYEEYEPVIKAWYAANGKLHNYKNYSNGKSVILAALKKSVYLITLESRGKQTRFRFATSHEIKENRRLLKEKGNNTQPLSPSNQPSVSSGYGSMIDSEKGSNTQPLSPLNPPSVSSGYGSMIDSEGENMQIDCSDQCISLEDLNEFLESSVNYNNDDLNTFLESIEEDANKENVDHLDSAVQLCNTSPGGRAPLQNSPPDGVVPLQNIYPDGVVPLQNIYPDGVVPLQNIYPDAVVPLQNIQHEDFKPEAVASQFMKPVTELKTTPVAISGTFKKYWLCTQKINLKGTLQIICELQITDENSGIKDGSYIIPGDVFEPGISYDLKKSFELNDLQYFFFSANCAEKEK